MKTVFALMMLCACAMTPVGAADPELAGNWVGEIDTARGRMEIGLSLKVERDALVGVLKTAHGDWQVTKVSQNNGVWTVGFEGGGNQGQMIGRIKDNTFAGEWKSKMADGTFELARARKKGDPGQIQSQRFATSASDASSAARTLSA